MNENLNFNLSTVPNTQQTVEWEVSSYNSGGTMQFVETRDGVDVSLGSVNIKGAGVFQASILPTMSSIRAIISGPAQIGLRRFCVKRPELKQENVLVTICPEDKDKYRFGFNGQEKVNEWAGIGNNLDFGERGYDSRIGRWLAADSRSKDAPSYTPYRFGFDNPIFFTDPNGEFEVTPEFAKMYPKVALLLMNADKIYYQQELPPEVKAAFKGVDINKFFNDNVREAFKEFSNLNEKQIKDMVTPHKGPLVTGENLDISQETNGYTEHRVVDLNTVGNYIDEKTNRVGWLQINNYILEVAEFELNGGDEKNFSGFGGIRATTEDKTDALMSLFSTLFHEGVHYGRYMTGKGNFVESTEQGKVFEEKAYGADQQRKRKNDLTPSNLSSPKGGKSKIQTTTGGKAKEALDKGKDASFDIN